MEITEAQITSELARHNMVNVLFSVRHAFRLGANWCRRQVFKELEERFPSAVCRIKAEMSKDEYLFFSGQK